MGGGDLNMKKSWHPLLMKNQERVWKEEKKALEERKKTAQLQKELAEERQLQELQRLQAEQGGGRREERVDWLYATPAIGNGINPEEQEAYLLGKKTVDKLFKEKDEAAAKLHAKAASQSDAAKAGGGFISLQNANTARDTASKIREDPLLAIKQREQLAYEDLKKNPAKLKALQSSLTTKEQSRKEKDERKRLKRELKEARKRKHDPREDDGPSRSSQGQNESKRVRGGRHHSRESDRDVSPDGHNRSYRRGSPDRRHRSGRRQSPPSPDDRHHRRRSPLSPDDRHRRRHSPLSPDDRHRRRQSPPADDRYRSDSRDRHSRPPRRASDQRNDHRRTSVSPGHRHRDSRHIERSRSRSPSRINRNQSSKPTDDRGPSNAYYSTNDRDSHRAPPSDRPYHDPSRRRHEGSGVPRDPPLSYQPSSHRSSDLPRSSTVADGVERAPVAQNKLSESKAAKLAAMQAAAKSLQESRSQRLEKLEAEDSERSKVEEAERERNRIRAGGVGDGNKASFVMEQEKKVFFGKMDLAERVRRSGGVGLLKDRE
ncbi:hypothetical protein PCANC_03819 [Puccinia coronata f. sp. avenae]|uniref:CBF1-interacting co-repressor CIR N-terminal domain-containing protein n=1 Tax=Puccinia coronata f. sp. avenae TaxID=200324 RepID=A0A2N5T7B9_9BASI|nr:hypothetical protein PCANC_03819 [Puccinia coronata f. sp. avenae]